jgi:anaerobic selenocysteine-containing dehydrogenase
MSPVQWITRREMLKATAAIGGAAALTAAGLSQSAPTTQPPKLPQRVLRKTGRSVGTVCLGTGTLHYNGA